MWSRRNLALSLVFCLLALTVLIGCRAFVPEVVIVNKPPETYITGAPAETSGGYYHYHIYWYGTDADGLVERFVWALTDTSVQDIDTDEDEEDQRFNPALNISTLEIGNWTTNTDSTFDFEIRQGSNLAYDMTLHLVAVDDRGDFDRTPARLHFISNALGQPVLNFTRTNGAGETFPFASLDTIAYGAYFKIAWSGSTPNIRSYDPEMLARRDTVGDIDGLFGFKYRILDVVCDESQEDCWRPREFDEEIGDSVSYFGNVTELEFRNEGPPDDPVSSRRLGSGSHKVLVNTTDVAGVQVPLRKQELNVIVNYDPDTRLLVDETDPFYTDPHTYPYYLVYYPNWVPGGARVEEYTFTAGDTVPDRAIVVFKAIARDDPRDLKLRTTQQYDVEFQGKFDAIGKMSGGSRFPFFTDFSNLNRTPDWESPVENSWSSDTLSFVAGPFDYSFVMRSVDEHGRRDGTADTLSFVGNFPPCVQCVEVTNQTDQSFYDETNACWDTDCAATQDTLYAAWGFPPPQGSQYATIVDFGGKIYYKLDTGDVWLTRPLQITGVDSVTAIHFGYKLWLHGKDHPLEPPVDPEDRVMSWRYQVDYENDPDNIIKDGGGIDNIRSPTYRFSTNSTDPVYIDDNGVWILKIRFGVPFQLLAADSLALGVEAYRQYLFEELYQDWDAVDEAFRLTTMQLGNGWTTVIARDATDCIIARAQKGKYHYFTHVRVPPDHGRQCFDDYPGEKAQLALNDFAAESAQFVKNFYLGILYPSGEIYPLPPGAWRRVARE